MAENPLKQLEHFGQAPWLDYIQRTLLGSPEYKRMLTEDGLKGMTSNPTIFEKAIDGSPDYDQQFEQLVGEGKEVMDIYEALYIRDIQTACDALRPLYDSTSSKHGYVSYEVSPLLANDTDGTIKAARRLLGPNLAAQRNDQKCTVDSSRTVSPSETLISEGINVNVTLMFSMNHYNERRPGSYQEIEKRAQSGGAIDRIFSVASFFVSRVETLVDKKLDAKAKTDASAAALKGKAAVANTKLVYQRYKEIFLGHRFAAMKQKGARTQWPLWASTGTKDKAYSDVKYIAELIGPDTVNTIPPATMDAFRDHGKVAATLEANLDQARDTVEAIAAALASILNQVGEELRLEGVELFKEVFR